MKVRLLTLTMVILLLLPSLAFALDHLYPATIERVIDGDTIEADLYLGLGVILDNQRIRLYGINAWETRGEEKPKGLLAKEYVVRRLEEGKVQIEIRPEWRKEQEGLREAIEKHEKANVNYLAQGTQILELAEKAYSLYLQQDPPRNANSSISYYRTAPPMAETFIPPTIDPSICL